MTKPVILIVDDEPHVLNAVERDLRKHFREAYQYIKAISGAEALEAVRQLKQRNTPLALFLVDQRMPGMTGIEFLAQARHLYPKACKVLLTAYADTEAAINSINEIGLDYYLMKPWDPPEQRLYPVLDDLLSDWKAKVPVPFDGVRVAGTLWSPHSHTVKDFLARNQIPYQWLDIEKDEEARHLVELSGQKTGSYQLPMVFTPDGTVLTQPNIRELAEGIGLNTEASRPFYDLVIIGAGPAGLAAAVYGASEGLETVIIEKEATGGQAGTSSRIENYLGFPNGLSGADLARRATIQARRLGAEIITAEEVVGMQMNDSYQAIQLSSGAEINCHSLLIATGVTVRRLPAPGIDRFTGAGVYYGAALTEAAFYRDQDMYVVGGGNSAGQAAIFFSKYGRRVCLVVRESKLYGMSKYLVDQLMAIDNIFILTSREVAEVHGENRLQSITLVDRNTKETETVLAAAMFIFIGAIPHTDLVGDLVARDRSGFILTGPDIPAKDGRPKGWALKRDPYLLETSCPGVFSAGDVRHGSVKRVASAVGEGAVAVALIHQYLKTV